MHSYTQLTESERNQIYALKQAGFKPSAIALQLSRHPSTIYRELRRNRGLRGYRPRQAQQMADNRRREKVKPKIRRSPS
ncbi:Transposase IS30-like HTH domain-containing protein [Candidatus Electronema halotolerans]